jgi:signal transduction histidine kinase
MNKIQNLASHKNTVVRYTAWAALAYSLGLLLIGLYGYIACLLDPFTERCSIYSVLDFVPFMVSLGFGLAGFVCIYFKRSLPEILFFLNGSWSLSSGMLSGTGSDLFGRLFYIHLALFAPITLQFYLSLLARPLRRVEQITLNVFYLLAIPLTLPLFFFTIPVLRQAGAFSFLTISIRGLFVAAVIGMVLLLGAAYRHFSTLSARRNIRLLCLGSAFAITPLILLTLLLQTIRANFVQSALTIPWLLAIPLIYFYTVFRSQVRFSEKFFSVILTYYLSFTFIFCVHAILISILEQAIPTNSVQVEVEGLILIFLLFLFNPFRKGIQSLVNWFFYGDETDYAVALRHLEKSLVNVLDQDELVAILLDELVLTTKVRGAALFLKQNQSILFVKANGIEADPLAGVSISPESRLYQYLSDLKSPVDTLQLWRDLARQALSPEESLLIHFPGIALWLPFVADNALQGLALLDYRVEDDLFSEADKELLTALIDHAGNAIRNVLMAENLRIGRKELAKAHQMVLVSQELERKRIARELHDESVQKLLGVSYQIRNLRKKVAANSGSDNNAVLAGELDLVRDELLDITTCLREMIGELRPVGLDEWGLPVVIEAFIDKLRAGLGQTGPAIEINIDQQLEKLPESLAIHIFRAAQEAVRNALKHARASTIFLDLYRTEAWIVLKVMDDGRGFQVPKRISEFSYSGHYGLTGIQERVQSVGGVLTISSVPGEGTEIIANFPIQGATHD